MRPSLLFGLSTLSTLALLTITMPIGAQDDQDTAATAIGNVHLAGDQFVDVAKPRELLRQDAIDGVTYRPGSHWMAVIGHRVADGRLYSTIHLVDGDGTDVSTLADDTFELRQIAQIDPTGDAAPEQGGVDDQSVDKAIAGMEADWDATLATFTLRGWSGDGRYLLVEQSEPTESRVKLLSIDALTDRPVIHDISLDGYYAVVEPDTWSPDGMRAAFRLFPDHVPDPASPPDPKRKAEFAVYDFATGQYKRFSADRPYVFDGWFDSDRVLLRFARGGKAKPYLTLNPNTGDATSMTQADVTALRKATPVDLRLCPTHPDLAFNWVDEQITQKDVSETVHSLWLRNQEPHGPQSAVAIAAANDVKNEPGPSAAWASDGKQLAYIMNGHLYVVDVPDHQPTLQEQFAAGDDMPCDQMQQAASMDLKQVGLGLLQYCEDYDEHFPPADNVDNRIFPYMQNSNVYGGSHHHWTYLAPPNLALASIQSPATTPIGQMTLPCSTVILYADGHVTDLDTTPASPNP